MALRTEHEIHGRRRSRNVGLGVVLLGFVALVFGLTVVKVQEGGLVEGYDHQPRVSLTPIEPQAPAVARTPVQEVTE
ncbi:hypothetical protein [Paracoccus sp. PAMC 22219]|uniref:hypothetical protein n=1 Tax=Paracoccus sp. PAMC 22219 TaxID=1569209 RepID=UPI0005A97A28|nr:hypothetical protein [Paracoccus sp. PAMC 22219]